MQGGSDRTLGPRNWAKQFDTNSAKLSVPFLAEPLTVCARPRQKNVERLPHRVEHPRHCTFLGLLNRSCVACLDPVCHDCSHRSLCTRCVLSADNTNNSFDISSSTKPICVTAEVNIVEEEQNMWRQIKKGTKFQLDAGRRSALLLSSQRVKPHFVAESLITSTVQDALSRTHVKRFLPQEFESDPEISLNLISQPRRSDD